MTLYWTARKLRSGRWRFEDGWESADKAERGARYYRREYRCRCVVVEVPDGSNKADMLRTMLAKS